ncbi:MAG: hypothetical protein WCO76_07320, partial [Planctomycetota bacterium]
MHRAAPSLAAFLFAITWMLPVAAAEPASPGELVRSAKRIAVLGDSITQDGRWVADLVAWMEEQ